MASSKVVRYFCSRIKSTKRAWVGKIQWVKCQPFPVEELVLFASAGCQMFVSVHFIVYFSQKSKKTKVL